MVAEMAGWEWRQINFVLSFAQAPIGSDFILVLPAGFHVDGENGNGKYFHTLKKNLYETPQATANWFDMLKTGIEDKGLKLNKVDPCLFVRNNCIVIFYGDDFCILSKYKEKIEVLLKFLSNTFNLTNEKVFDSYVGINASKYVN